MRKLLPIALAVVALAAPAGAGAATEVGNLCEAKLVAKGTTATQLTRASSSALPLSAPAGVVTSWRVNIALTKQQFSNRLVVLRPAGGDNFAIVGESEPTFSSGGINLFPTRLPVEAGDRFGLSGEAAYCESAVKEDVIGFTMGDTPLGSTHLFDDPEEESLLSLSANVEPDADRDGYGDETQDACPISAARQTACPPVISQAAPIIRKNGGGVLVLVTTTGPITVSVSGTVALPKRATARLTPVSGPVAPPTMGRFLLKLPPRVKKTLAELPRGEALSLTLKASMVDEIGRTSDSNRTIRLRSTKPPAPKPRTVPR